MSVSNEDVVLSFINFLKTSIAKKEIDSDYFESIDVAIDCIADAFDVDKDNDQSTITQKFGGKSLIELVSSALSQSSGSSSSDSKIAVNIDTDDTVDADIKAKAEALKLEGNRAMSAKDFDTAITKYTAAIDLTPNNVVYLSNRAAAYSSKRFHELAVKDSETAIKIDPSFAKAYSRLGLAKYALGDAKASMDAYKKGLEVEGDKKSEAMNKGYETARRRVQDQLESSMQTTETADRSSPSDSGASAGGFPDLGNLASMLGGGGAGGMPDLSAMMKNPQMMQMAQQMMSNPSAMKDMMSNPAIAQMAKNFGLGGGADSEEGSGSGGMPDLSEMMNNPMLKNLANQFLGGQGGNGANRN